MTTDGFDIDLRRQLAKTKKEVGMLDAAIRTARTEIATLQAENERLREAADEAERLMRLTAAKACGYDTGDQSLEFLRKGQSPELADLSIAIDMRIESLEREVRDGDPYGPPPTPGREVNAIRAALQPAQPTTPK